MMLRPYRPGDLPAVTRFIGACWRDDSFANYHPGDFLHWMSNGYRGEGLEHHFQVVEEDGQILAVVELDAKGSYASVIDAHRRGGTWELEVHRTCLAVLRERLKQTVKKTVTINLVKGDKASKACLEQLEAISKTPKQ